MNPRKLSPRTRKLFAEAEHLAALLAEINVEETKLRRSAAALEEAKLHAIALLADAAREASVAESVELLKHVARSPRRQTS